MTRYTAAVAIFIAPLVAAAAPVPKPTDKERLARWGTVVTSDPEDAVVVRGEQVVVRAAGGPAFPPRPQVGPSARAPRVVREVTGDFDVSVRVVDLTPPAVAPPDATASTEVEAGLAVSAGGESFSLFRHRGQLFQDDGPPSRDDSLWVSTVAPRLSWSKPTFADAGGGPRYVRLTREKGSLIARRSRDGKTWVVVDTSKAPPPALPDRVTVGVYLSQNVGQTSEAVFEDYKLTVTPAAGK